MLVISVYGYKAIEIVSSIIGTNAVMDSSETINGLFVSAII